MKLADRIEQADGWLDYHLNNYDNAKDMGSLNSAERSLNDAAKWAAISTALRLRAQEAGRQALKEPTQ